MTRPKTRKPPRKPKYVCQFLVVLPGTDPLVWRRILVPEAYSADGGRYPRCIAGAGACPPEDVGGTVGYADFLQIIRNPEHSEHAETLSWVGGAFDAHAFDPASVEFDDPRKRWRTAFQEG
jgi:hypothetical protein